MNKTMNTETTARLIGRDESNERRVTGLEAKAKTTGLTADEAQELAERKNPYC